VGWTTGQQLVLIGLASNVPMSPDDRPDDWLSNYTQLDHGTRWRIMAHRLTIVAVSAVLYYSDYIYTCWQIGLELGASKVLYSSW